MTIPGIGTTFEKDFARIGITDIQHLVSQSPDDLFSELSLVNAAELHATCKNYLYMIRMAVYYANGGRDPDMMRWSHWKD
jgi:Pathogenicity locus